MQKHWLSITLPLWLSFFNPVQAQPKQTTDGKYLYPFNDRSYVLAIGNCNRKQPEDRTCEIRFFHQKANAQTTIWKENLSIQYGQEAKKTDFNGDGVADFLIMKGTGARGSNELFYLFLTDPKAKKLVKVKGFEELPNPTYYPKHKVVLSYSFAGKNYYSIYRIGKQNQLLKIGNAFEDSFDGDEKILNAKIEATLKQHQIDTKKSK